MEQRIFSRTRTPIDPMIGERLYQLRVAQHMGQAELAYKAGVSFTVISRLEHGKQSVSAERLRDLAKVLRTTPNFLLGVDEEESHAL